MSSARAVNTASAAGPGQGGLERDGPLLSFGQERLWFLHQISPDAVSFNMARAVRVTGTLDTDVLRQAFDMVVARHELLRTTFATNARLAAIDSQPYQIIAAPGDSDFRVLDFRYVAESDRDRTATETARTEIQRPLDLTSGPLARLTLLAFSRDDHAVLVNTHGIVCDDASLTIVLDEMWECYRAVRCAERPDLRELPLQWAAHAARQRRLPGNREHAEIEFWRRKLAGAPARLELPADRPRPSVQGWHGSAVSRVIPADLAGGLRGLARREEAALFDVLVGAFVVLIGRYSGQTDIVISSMTANRGRDEARTLVGPLSDPMILRSDLSGNPSFARLLEQVKRTIADAHAHHTLPFEKLLNELHVERSLSHAPVSQVMLNVTGSSAIARAVDGLRIHPLPFDTGIAPLDLTVNVHDTVGRLECVFEYNTDLFDADTISRMAAHFERVLAAFVADVEQPIERVSLLTESERRRMAVEWNETDRSFPHAEPFHELFAAQSARTPDAIAVICGADRLTYRELDRQSNRLARYLVRRGVGPETVVGLCVERSAKMVVGLLGIAKAGGAYLPLDPGLPSERLNFMVADSGASLVVMEEATRPRLPGLLSAVCIDSDRTEIDLESPTAPTSAISADNLVYVIYTSGSTGMPKGVMVTHGGLHNYLCWAKDAYFDRSGHGSLVHSPLAFDLTVTSLLAPLVCGRSVTLLPEQAVLEEMSAALRDGPGYCLLKLTPAHIEGLGYMLAPEDVAGKVGALVIGGEALRAESLAFWRSADPALKIVNEYGPTETVVGCCVHEVTPDARAAGEIPIGRPIANTQLYILGKNLQPVPIGVLGELYIGGAGVARGYCNRPDLTAEQFVPDPFARHPGQRLYATGDLARYRANGCIDFVGRDDAQVKIRGHRVELREIEATLSEHPTVNAAVVLLLDRAGQKHLAAYVVPAGNGTVVVEDLRAFARSKLPEYMIPTAITVLDALPLTVNGKVDRRMLATLELPRGGTEYRGPRDLLEEQLVKIWEVVLGVHPIGITDDFFEAGGHSLLAARLFAQIDNRFNRKLPLATLFQARTIEELAVVLRAQETRSAWASLVPVRPQGTRPPLFCVHAAGANVLIYRPLARHLDSDQPLYSLQAVGLDGRSKPYVQVERMAAHYISEIRQVQPEGPYHLVGASFGGLVVFEMAQQLVAQGQRVALLAMLNTNCPVYSTLARINCHLFHLRKSGPRRYLTSSVRSVIRNLVKEARAVGVEDISDRVLQEAVSNRVDTGDPLARTVLAIFEAERTYRPTRYPGRISFFWARDAERGCEDNRLGWRKLAAGGFDVYEIPGNHASIREEPNVAKLAETLAACLDRARGGEAVSGAGSDTTVKV
jgi:amino acid adenylation domain-containing protein